MPRKSDIEKLNDGRYKLEFQSARYGIKRTRLTFDTRGLAQAHKDFLIENALRRMKGQREIYTFGQALFEYLSTISADKLSADSDMESARRLCIPFRLRGAWCALTDGALDDSDSGIIPLLAGWVQDQKRIVKTRRIAKEEYQLRKEPTGGTLWYHQPKMLDDGSVPRRVLVNNKVLIKQCEQGKGLATPSSDTLRRRQMLVSGILSTAYKSWRWTGENLAGLIIYEETSAGRDQFLPENMLSKLVDYAYAECPSFARLIRGASEIGWRKSNLKGLTWDRIVWPTLALDSESGEYQVMEPGYIWVEAVSQSRANRSKNKRMITTVMTDRVFKLLVECWNNKKAGTQFNFEKGPSGSEHVFLNESNRPWGDYRKRWETAKKAVGIKQSFVWHDLRHTWATHALESGTDERSIQDQQGWKDPRMVKRYAKNLMKRRYEQLNQ